MRVSKAKIQVNPDNPDDFEYSASVENSLAIMREINQITFLERMESLMTEVTKELIKGELISRK